MTYDEIKAYEAGYQECRGEMVREIKTILEGAGDVILELSTFVNRALFQMDEDNWASIQKEFPSMTREEYERGNELFLELSYETQNALH